MVTAVSKSASPVQFKPQAGHTPFTPLVEAATVDSREALAVVSRPEFEQALLATGVSERDLKRLSALANRFEEQNLRANRDYNVDALAKVAHGLLTEFHSIKFESDDNLSLYTTLLKLVSRNLVNDLQPNDFTEIAAKLFAFDRSPDASVDPRIAEIAHKNLGASLTLGREELFANTAKAYLAIWDLIKDKPAAEQQPAMRLAEKTLLQAVTSQIPAHLVA